MPHPISLWFWGWFFKFLFPICFLSCATLCVTLHSFLSLLITSNHVLVALYCTSPPLSFARLFLSTGSLCYLSSWNAQTMSAYFPSVFWSCYQTSFYVLIVYCTLPGNFTHPYFCHMQLLLICIFWCPKLCLIQHNCLPLMCTTSPSALSGVHTIPNWPISTSASHKKLCLLHPYQSLHLVF